MTKTLLTVAAAALMGTTALAVDQATKAEAVKGCCARKAKAAATDQAKAQKLRCTLTGKVVDKCCCVEREGKTHCTLADKDVATCCCKPVTEGEKKP